jgi:hypothetical protein
MRCSPIFKRIKKKLRNAFIKLTELKEFLLMNADFINNICVLSVMLNVNQIESRDVNL